MKNRFLAAAPLLYALSLCPGAHAADDVVVYEAEGPPVRHSSSLVRPGFTATPMELRALSRPDATALLASSEGAAWSVLGVEAPQCTVAEERALKRQRKKAEAKECRHTREICRQATQFAQAHGATAACSSLYVLTTVLLTTKPVGAKQSKPGLPVN